MKHVTTVVQGLIALHRIVKYLSLDSLVYIWFFIVIGSNLQAIIFPHLDWVVAFLVGLATLPAVWARRKELPWSIFVGPAMITASILATACVSEAPFYNVAQAGKVAAMTVWGLAFFTLHPGMALKAVRTNVVVMAVNAVLLLAWSSGWGLLAGLATGDKRSRTFLNVPGTLGGVGLCILVYGLYLVFSHHRRLYGALVAAGSLVLVYFENSRTVTPLAVLAVLFAVVVVLRERFRGVKRPVLALGGAAAVLAVACTAVWLVLPSRFGRLLELVLEKGLLAGLASSDPVRASMIETAIEAVSSFPILGSGMGTLGVVAPHGWIEVHMAYLQLWSDAGFFAFLGFVWVVVEWLRWVPSALRAVRTQAGSEQSALVYNSVFLMVAFALTNLLHTFSTEWAQWLPYLVSYAILYNAAKSEREGELRSASQL